MSKQLVTGLALLGLSLAAPPARAQAPDRPVRQPQVYLGLAARPTAPDAEQAGVVVRDVDPDSPAQKAGIRRGDVVVKIGDKEVKDFDALVSALAAHKPGDKVPFRVVQGGEEKSVEVTLGERTPRRGPEGRGPGRGRPAFLGVQTQRLTPELRERLEAGAEEGLVITDVVEDTPASKAGLRREDVITAVDGKKVSDPEDLREAVRQAGAGKEVTLQVVRGKEKKEVKARLEEGPVDGLSDVPFRPPIGPGGRLGVPGGRGSAELERRIQELEKRVRELEKRGQPPK